MKAFTPTNNNISPNSNNEQSVLEVQQSVKTATDII